MKAASLVALSLAFVGILLNLQTGWQLSQTEEIRSDWHLIVAVFTLVSTLVAGALILILSGRILDSARRQVALDKLDPQVLKTLDREKDRSLPLVIASMALALISLISGTISHAGRFPWLHGLLGFILAFSLFLSLVYWVYFLRLTPRQL